MKKIYIILPLILLFAAGCGSSKSTTQTPPQQSEENTQNLTQSNQITTPTQAPSQSTPPPAQNNQVDLSKLPRITTSEENQRVNNLFQMYVTAIQQKDINTLTKVFQFPTEQAQKQKDEDGFWSFSKYSLYQAVVKTDNGKIQHIKAYYIVPDKNNSQKSNIFIVTGDYSISGNTAYISPWQVYPTIYNPMQYSSQAEIDSAINTFLKTDLES